MIWPKLTPGGEPVDPGSSAARGTLLVYIAALIAADATALLLSVQISLICYAGALFVILTQLAFFSSGRLELQTALAGLALVPTLKIGAIALPQQLASGVYWEAFPAALALAVVIALRAIGQTSPGGLRPWRPLGPLEWGTQLLIGATGPVFAVAGALVLSAVDRSVANPALVSTPVTVLLVAAFSGFMLEVVFRGILQPSLVRLFGPRGVALASVLYAGLFLSSGSVFAIVLALVTGLAWGVLAAITRTARGVALSHALFSMTWAALY